MKNKKTIQFYEVAPEEFWQEIPERVEKLPAEFSKLFTPKEPEVWLSRKDVAELLGISPKAVTSGVQFF